MIRRWAGAAPAPFLLGLMSGAIVSVLNRQGDADLIPGQRYHRPFVRNH